MPNKWIAAILNFLFPGAGYLYAGKKRFLFSAGLTLSTAIFLVYFLYSVAILGLVRLIPDKEIPAVILFNISIFIGAFAFAWDAFKDAEEK